VDIWDGSGGRLAGTGEADDDEDDDDDDADDMADAGSATAALL